MTNEIEIMKEGIRVNGQYFPAHYSPSTSDINGNATIYIKTYATLPSIGYSISPSNKYFNIVNELAGA